MNNPTFLSISEASSRLQTGDMSATELVNTCLARIRKRDKIIKAWAEVYEEHALAEAKTCDETLSRGDTVPPLHGIPIGVKDIIDVRGMWTRAGCTAYEAKIARSDAAAVARLRLAGAIILGKTVTTPFANNDPALTCNPVNTEHTPGGSSSGSGAAVADQMCLAALGTQTGGSILRPAAYTGIVGLKPTYGAISVDGVIPVSLTLDHIGPLVTSVADAKLLFELLQSPNPEQYAYMLPIDMKVKKSSSIEKPLRLGFFNKFSEKKSDAETISHVENVCHTIQNGGASIIDLDCTENFAEAAQAHRIIMDTELAQYHWENYIRNKSKYPPNISERIEKGRAHRGYDYVTAVMYRIHFQKRLYDELAGVDAAILPTTPSSAPKGLASTGSPIFCVPWSMAGFPVITIPSGSSTDGLPYGIQIVAKPYQENTLFAVAAWCEKLFT